MKKINEIFQCINCKKTITPANKTCRNHCPFCFVSLHVDGEIPGDRKSECEGWMYPINFENKTKGIRILFECNKCHKQHRNKQSDDDNIINLQNKIEEYKMEFIG